MSGATINHGVIYQNHKIIFAVSLCCCHRFYLKHTICFTAVILNWPNLLPTCYSVPQTTHLQYIPEMGSLALFRRFLVEKLPKKSRLFNYRMQLPTIFYLANINALCIDKTFHIQCFQEKPFNCLILCICSFPKPGINQIIKL